MSRMRFLVLAVAILGAAGSVAKSSGAGQLKVTPIQKVVQLLGELLAKGTQEKHDEEVKFAKFHEWCDQTRAATTKNIQEAEAKIQQLTADIAKAGADAETLAGEIKELEASTAKAQAELQEATAIREKEHAEFQATHRDFSESVDALERAIAALKSRAAAVPQSLLQLQRSAALPLEAKAAIASFLALAGGDADEAGAAPEANAYEFQSGSVVALLEKLRLKFQDQRLAAEKEEANAKGNFELLAQKLTDSIQDDTKRTGEKTGARAQRLEDAATGRGDLSITEAGKAEDETKLSDTLTACSTRSDEFEKNQVVRSEEIKTIEKAVAILSSDEVAGAADKHLPAAAALAQTRARPGHRVPALVQLLRGAERPADAQRRRRLAAFLEGRAKKLNSKYLALIAAHAGDDPFGKVKQLIKDLIVKLMEEANSEADHKAYCDAELATNKQTRENKQAEVDQLVSSIEKGTAESAGLQDDVATLSDAVSTLRREQSEATDIRGQEKATNAQTVAEAKDAQVAVEKAIQLLKDFYAKSADAGAASLLQRRAGGKDGLSHKAPYTGFQDESGGILGFLDVILSDFARLETETSTAEDQAAAAYQKFMDESNQDIAVKQTEIEHKTSKKQTLDADIAGLQSELHLTQDELSAAVAYYDKLKPDCVDQGLSYEERVRLREEEIQSLQEALEILSSEDLA